jgi:hypothetical protein
MRHSSRNNLSFIRWMCLALLLAVSLGCSGASASSTTLPAETQALSVTGTPVLEVEREETLTPAALAPESTAALLLPEVLPTDTPTSFSFADPTKVLVTPSADEVKKMIAQVDPERALNDLRQLTGDIPICTEQGCTTIMNRATGSEGLQWAKDYVSQELDRLGYEVELREWSREGRADQNILAVKRGTIFPEQEIYFVAHLDGVELDGQTRLPAADDNGSGVVDLLELSRVLSPYSLGRTLVLFFSTGEEEGALGVSSYLDQLPPEELNAIQGVVDIDMVGYDGDDNQVMELWSGEHAPSLAFTKVLSETITAYALDLVPRFITGCN